MRLELLDTITLPGDPAKPNEDSFVAISRMAAVFDGATEKDIKSQLKAAKLPSSGKIQLHEGISGQPFEQPVQMVSATFGLSHGRDLKRYCLVVMAPTGQTSIKIGRAHV